LYKFATYVKWPEGAFADAKSPFVIGILGTDPVGADLRKIAAVKKIDGRKIEVRNFKNVKNIHGCHILFISRAVKSETQAAGLKQLMERNILFVGETRDFLKNGGVIDFVVQQNRVKIFISKSAYEREHLEISAKLLRVATVVR
ncbi:MAG: YfiR family protein, partial [Thermoguttaceae bacterium]